MQHLLGIIGSPRKGGNTHILVSKVLEAAAGGAPGSGTADKETAAGRVAASGRIAGRERAVITGPVFLADLHIEECDGCHACWKGKLCSKKDDMNGLYQRIIEADILVLGTPVYWYGPTAIMKAFIDRLVYFNCPQNRAKIRGKNVAVVIPFEEEDKTTGEFVAEFFYKCFAYLEMKPAGKLIVPGVGERGAVLKKSGVLKAAAELGRCLVE